MSGTQSGRDELVRIDLPDRGMVAFAAEVTAAAREAEFRHLSGRVAAESLARLMAAAVLAGGFLQKDERQSLQVKSAGHLRGALVDYDAQGHLRGYTDMKVLPLIDRGPTDVEHYLETSEQRPSLVEMAVSYADQVDYVGGVLLQAGPGCDAQEFAALRGRREELRQALLEERVPLAALERVLKDERRVLVERRRLSFRCHCTRERVVAMVGGLDLAELKDMLAKDAGAHVTCHFCNDVFELDAAALEELIARKEGRLAGPAEGITAS